MRSRVAASAPRGRLCVALFACCSVECTRCSASRGRRAFLMAVSCDACHTSPYPSSWAPCDQPIAVRQLIAQAASNSRKSCAAQRNEGGADRRSHFLVVSRCAPFIDGVGCAVPAGGAWWRFVWRGKTRARSEKGALFAFDGRWGATIGAGCGRSVHKVRWSLGKICMAVRLRR